MTIVEERVQAPRTKVEVDELSEIQKLALTGYDFDHMLHVVLRIDDAGKAREFLSAVLESDFLTFSDRPRDRDYAVNIGFTFRGLVKLGLPESYARVLARKAASFHKGAPARAAAVGDSGEGAAERWERPFHTENADVLICICGKDSKNIEDTVRAVAALPAAREGFDGWDRDWMRAEHMGSNPRNRQVHFGFRDNVVRHVVHHPLLKKNDKPRHSAGELLLGYQNDSNFNHWKADRATAEEISRFFSNGTFGILRKIEQDVDRFDDFVRGKAKELRLQGIKDLPDDENELVQYVKAKLCGRWPNGARIKPGETTAPHEPSDVELQNDSEFDFISDDKDGAGCPFGAHIRRANPRKDPALPERRRPLFRRGVPYTHRTVQADGKERVERGLLGLFFCASIEDQFEHVLSEWIEKMPMGPASRGNARDPLIGQHDGSRTEFHIPGGNGSAGMRLKGFDAPFVTTRGTLYALFPSCRALREIAAFVDSV